MDGHSRDTKNKDLMQRFKRDCLFIIGEYTTKILAPRTSLSSTDSKRAVISPPQSLEKKK